MPVHEQASCCLVPERKDIVARGLFPTRSGSLLQEQALQQVFLDRHAAVQRFLKQPNVLFVLRRELLHPCQQVRAAIRLVLPDGMSYSVLVLPDSQYMTPEMAHKIAQAAEHRGQPRST